jgi:hypothetical protein
VAPAGNTGDPVALRVELPDGVEHDSVGSAESGDKMVPTDKRVLACPPSVGQAAFARQSFTKISSSSPSNGFGITGNEKAVSTLSIELWPC